MLNIAAELHQWCTEGRDFAVATVVAVDGSAPRQPGAALAVDTDGNAVGSVSGGCVEGAVYELCRGTLGTGQTALEQFSHSDDALAIGLPCGGAVDILVTPVRNADPVRPLVAAGVAAAAAGKAVALARATKGPDDLVGQALLVHADGAYEGTLGGDPALDASAASEVAALLAAGRTQIVEVASDRDCSRQPVVLLVESSVPPPRLIVFGANDFSSALVRMGKFLGYHVTVCDARPVFATRSRFPEADEIVVAWPHNYLDSTRTDGRTVLCLLTHDAKFDIPLLSRALKLPVAYIGAMGSQRTHQERLKRLREAGTTELELTQLRSPIGLDLGAWTPEEVAVSIAGEIVADREGGSGARLNGFTTPIHFSGSKGADRWRMYGLTPAARVGWR